MLQFFRDSARSPVMVYHMPWRLQKHLGSGHLFEWLIYASAFCVFCKVFVTEICKIVRVITQFLNWNSKERYSTYFHGTLIFKAMIWTPFLQVVINFTSMPFDVPNTFGAMHWSPALIFQINQTGADKWPPSAGRHSIYPGQSSPVRCNSLSAVDAQKSTRSVVWLV